MKMKQILHVFRKKIIHFAALLAAAALTFSFAGCAEKDENAVRVAALYGPTGLGMIKLMEDGDAGKTANDYEFTLAGSVNELAGRLADGDFDIAAVPTNWAATFYQKNGGYKIAAINTLGVLYLLEKGNSVTDAASLRGKTIYLTGQGATPEYALRYVLSMNGIDPDKDVTLVYKSEHSELAALMASDLADIALLPQPFVTSVITADPSVRIALDWNEEWAKVTDGGGTLAMGCIIVRDGFAEENPEALDIFLGEYKTSAEFALESVAKAAPLAEKFGVMNAAIAEKAMPECGITAVFGSEMKELAGNFLKVLYEADPKSVGGSMPDDDFYFLR